MSAQDCTLSVVPFFNATACVAKRAAPPESSWRKAAECGAAGGGGGNMTALRNTVGGDEMAEGRVRWRWRWPGNRKSVVKCATEPNGRRYPYHVHSLPAFFEFLR